MKKVVIISLLLLALGSIEACNAPKKTAKPVASKEKADTVKELTAKPAAVDPVKITETGMEFQILKHGMGTRKPVLNDKIEIKLTVKIEDSVIFDSKTMNKNNPIILPIAKAKFKGDPVEGYLLMAEGDSGLFRIPVDTLLKSGSQMPPWMKEGKKLEYDVVMLSIKTDSEIKKDNEIKMAAQKETDDKLLQEYFTKNNLHPVKTTSGLYYIITKEGTGELPKAGNILNMFYTGRFLGGNVFDTNQDSTFHHQDPLKVELGKGRVIKGWDEGLALLKKGSSATLYIPSYLAYGPKDKGTIPGNSILIFDLIVSDIQTVEEMDEKILKDYFAANKVTAQKTASGLYYEIKKKGKGPLPKQGQMVTVNYTGKTIDGNVFDSNLDTNFHHAEPFKFDVGKGRVIKGWDEGVALLNKGTKATLYLPSRLAYGSQGQGRKIPPNTILIFDIELLNIDNTNGK